MRRKFLLRFPDTALYASSYPIFDPCRIPNHGGMLEFSYAARNAEHKGFSQFERSNILGNRSKYSLW